jgi:hypothetical protein
MTPIIASAFVKAQCQFGPALKTATNPQFRKNYADLSACIEAVIDALNSNGIGLLQATHECSDGVIVETMFVHESGETMSSGKLHVPAQKFDPQGYGSALTYARRYSLMAACGIAPEDDDGNAAAEKQPPATKGKATTKPAAGAASNAPAAPAEAELLTKDQVAKINALATEVGKPIKDITAAYKVSSLAFIKRTAFEKIIERMEAMRAPQDPQQ